MSIVSMEVIMKFLLELQNWPLRKIKHVVVDQWSSKPILLSQNLSYGH